MLDSHCLICCRKISFNLFKDSHGSLCFKHRNVFKQHQFILFKSYIFGPEDNKAAILEDKRLSLVKEGLISFTKTSYLIQENIIFTKVDVFVPKSLEAIFNKKNLP